METIRRETSDGQISDDQTGSVVCGVCSPHLRRTAWRWEISRLRFTPFEMTGGRDLRKEI